MCHILSLAKHVFSELMDTAVCTICQLTPHEYPSDAAVVEIFSHYKFHQNHRCLYGPLINPCLTAFGDLEMWNHFFYRVTILLYFVQTFFIGSKSQGLQIVQSHHSSVVSWYSYSWTVCSVQILVM
jgi:hypothetical protein